MAFLDPDVVVNPVKEEFALLLLAEFSISLMLSSLALDMAGLFKPFILVSSVSIATFWVACSRVIFGKSAWRLKEKALNNFL